MLNKEIQKHSEQYKNVAVEEGIEKKEKIEFDWKDVLAFTIASFQVILPYAAIMVGSYFVIMLLFQIIMVR